MLRVRPTAFDAQGAPAGELVLSKARALLLDARALSKPAHVLDCIETMVAR